MIKKKETVYNATIFKAKYTRLLGIEPISIEEKTFNSIKSMEQWISRNDEAFNFMLIGRYAFIRGAFEPFCVVGKQYISLSEMKKMVNDLEECKFIAKNNKIQKRKSEVL